MYFLIILNFHHDLATWSLKKKTGLVKNNFPSLIFFSYKQLLLFSRQEMYNNLNPLRWWLVTPKVLNGIHLANQMNYRVPQKQSGTKMADAMRCHFPVIKP